MLWIRAILIYQDYSKLRKQVLFYHSRKIHSEYEIIVGDDLLEGIDDLLRDHIVQFKGRCNTSNYRILIRWIVFFTSDLG